MIIYISKSDKCGKGSDGTMFLEMKLYNKMHIGDCLAMDGGYNLYINKFKEETCLLKNIWQMVDKYKIPSQPHHKLWYTDNFEFPTIDQNSDNEEDTVMEEVQLKHKKLKKVIAVVIPKDKN
ncbi:hypothetical protein BDA99DRAFT_549497 [Phascolomyces articulosus]|uniref:DDE Tnp4 domain-containing protein n=1 Tax=Phascolomyces articulosus TaxID=60185 RepID=A0AAD5JYE6_9FUNG|nr:hypothetical protein BDA99DRAFT_549497 [Phascolomyces articulosus]